MAATNCSDSTVLPVIFNGTCPNTGNNLRQVLLPANVGTLDVDLMFPVVTNGYFTFVGTDDTAAGALTDPSPIAAKVWYRLPRMTDPAKFFVASATSDAAFKIRLSRGANRG